MRISDWSSDVCSSDLVQVQCHGLVMAGSELFTGLMQALHALHAVAALAQHHMQQTAGVRLVFDDQDSRLAVAAVRFGWRYLDRQLAPEGGALAGYAVEADRTAHAFDQLLEIGRAHV